MSALLPAAEAPIETAIAGPGRHHDGTHQGSTADDNRADL
jgi:hypothetical protein